MLRGSDADDEGERQCRICWGSQNARDLIAPCACSGSVKWVHRECIERWRAEAQSTTARTQCDLCRFRFLTEPKGKRVGARLRANALVVREVAAVCVIILAVPALMGAAIYLCDGSAEREGSVWAGFRPVVAYYLMGALTAVHALGILGFVALSGASKAGLAATMCLWLCFLVFHSARELFPPPARTAADVAFHVVVGASGLAVTFFVARWFLRRGVCGRGSLRTLQDLDQATSVIDLSRKPPTAGAPLAGAPSVAPEGMV